LAVAATPLRSPGGIGYEKGSNALEFGRSPPFWRGWLGSSLSEPSGLKKAAGSAGPRPPPPGTSERYFNSARDESVAGRVFHAHSNSAVEARMSDWW